MKQSKAKTRNASDEFKAVARRLECDEDSDRFERSLKKIAKSAPKSPKSKKPD